MQYSASSVRNREIIVRCRCRWGSVRSHILCRFDKKWRLGFTDRV